MQRYLYLNNYKISNPNFRNCHFSSRLRDEHKTYLILKLLVVLLFIKSLQSVFYLITPQTKEKLLLEKRTLT